MRGKGNGAATFRITGGITPAYAGKSVPFLEIAIVRQDHPRLCGEKFIRLFPCLTQWGSPPPMRGKVHFVHVYKSVPRITPAYAGKSFRKIVDHTLI